MFALNKKWMSFKVFGIDAVNHSTYSGLQKGLHAISMMIIVWLMTSGYFAAYITRIPEVKEAVSAFNVALATLFAPVFVFRMCVSFGKGYADVLRSSDVMRYAAFVVHNLIYITTLIVIVSGFLMMNRDIDVFGLFYIPAVITDPRLHRWFSDSHTLACYGLALLLFMHVAAVIKHHLTGRPVLKGMFF